jgi:hypothetical protein
MGKVESQLCSKQSELTVERRSRFASFKDWLGTGFQDYTRIKFNEDPKNIKCTFTTY